MAANLPDKESRSATGILIPVEPKRFGEFIASLLETPRRVQRTKEMIFDLDLQAVRDFYHLIHYRMNDQHIAEEVYFSCSFHYEDGRSVELRSIQEVEGYAEIGDENCVGTSLAWVYLVKLPGSEEPRKHIIEVSFWTGQYKDREQSGRQFSSKSMRKYRYPTCEYFIEHSNVTWGNDVANLLDQRINQIEKTDRFSGFFRRSFAALPLLGLLSGIIVFAFGALWIRLTLPDFGGSPQDFLSYEVTGKRYIYDVVSTIFTVLTVALVGLGSMILKDVWARPRPATISLSERAKKRNTDLLRPFGRRWINLGAGIAATLILGVVSSLVASSIWDYYHKPATLLSGDDSE